MTTATLTRVEAPRVADAALKAAAAFWFAVALLGQWLFLYYISVFYGPSTLTGNFQAWTKNHVLLKGYVPGDTAGNLAFGAHALLVGYVEFGGALQVIPWFRNTWPRLHRWNGRVFLVTAMGVSLTGLYMVWVRGASAGLVEAIAISGNAAAILLFGVLAWRAALQRDFAAHRRNALRTYLVANGQWFLRVGLFGWIIANRGPVGIGKHLDGPVAIFLTYGCYLVPLTVLELYLYVQKNGGARGRYAMATLLVLLTLFTALGIFGAYMFIWRPVLARL